MNKKLALMFALMAVLVMGAATSASAAELKASGSWMIESSWRSMDFNKAAEETTFQIAQRMRTHFEFKANENLKAVLGTEIGSASWGNGLFQVGSGRAASTVANVNGANAAGFGNIMLYKGYLDFNLPGTKINALVGYMPLALPAAFGGGSAILDEQAAAAVISAPLTDNVKIVAGFTRLADANAVGSAATVTGGGGNLDAYFAALPIDYKGFSIAPFAAYATGGSKSGAAGLAGLKNTNATDTNAGLRAYWGGAAFTMSAFDPFKVMADFNYGKATYNNAPNRGKDGGGREGYLFDVAVDYTGLSMMTPEVFYIYTSGENSNDANNTKSHRMPMVSAQTFAVGSFFMQGDSMLWGSINAPNNNIGFWAAGVSLKDIKVIDKLSSTFNLIYFKGTNSDSTLRNTNVMSSSIAYGSYLTTKDSLWEVDLNNSYKIYEELALNLDLGYLNTSFDKSLWAPIVGTSASNLSENAYKVNLGLVYSF